MILNMVYFVFIGMGRMEGKSGREAFTEFKAKFWQVYKVNLVITNNF